MRKGLIVVLALVALLALPGAVAADGPSLIVGDVDMDGMTTMADASMIMRYRAGLVSLSADQLRCGDTDADGMVTMADVMHIRQYRADPTGELGILYKPLYDPVCHAGMIDPNTL